MPKAEVNYLKAVLFVEMNGETYRVTLPNERMELLLPLAASLFDNGKLGLAPTDLFSFEAVRNADAALAADQMNKEQK
jgi:hypothetical protein